MVKRQFVGMLLIVLNGIEISNRSYGQMQQCSFNRTKWN